MRDNTDKVHTISIGDKGRRVRGALLWLALSAGLLIAIFTVIREMCLATACSDAASFTIFGMNMGFFGIAFFSIMLIAAWLRKRAPFLEWVLSAGIFSGAGAELRLLWIQKYSIGSFCPLCVSICCTLFAASILQIVDHACVASGDAGEGGHRRIWFLFCAGMMAVGCAVAFFGVRQLTE